MHGARKIGILGGTFNPIHHGHLLLAQCALETCSLSRVLFIPCARPPHKDAAGLAPAGHRLAMVNRAIEDNPFFEASEIEIRRGGTSYAIDTVAELREQYPDAELLFIVGADTLKELYLWREISTLLALCTFISFGRPDHEARLLQAPDLHLTPMWSERLLKRVSKGRAIEISSSEIRHRVAEGLSIRYLVPKSVETYIGEQGLYGGG